LFAIHPTPALFLELSSLPQGVTNSCRDLRMVWGSPVEERCWHARRGYRRGPLRWLGGLDHNTCREMLEELGSFSLEKGKAVGMEKV